MSDNLESLNNDGGHTVKMDLNYSVMCDEKIAEAESLRASGKLQEALDMLLVVENETRNWYVQHLIKIYNLCNNFDITPTLDNPTQRMMTKYLLNLSSISNSSELNKIPDLTKTDEHLDDSSLSNLSMELSKIDSLFPTQSIQKFLISSDVMDSGGNDNFEFDDVIKINKPFSSKNKNDLSVLEDLAEGSKTVVESKYNSKQVGQITSK
ncbi:hypothetical protein QTP88_011601 [Uroleucon formosanum]